MMEDNYYELIIAYFDKTISDEGLNQLQCWIDESAENQASFSDTIQILEASRAYLNTPAHIEQSWAKIKAHASANLHKKPSSINSSWLYVAAACFMVGVVGWFGYRAVLNNLQPEYDTVSNTDGRHSKITLPDRSTVILSGGSTLKYVKNFDGDKRLVLLNGEAFFDVVHLDKKPFIVKTGKISTVVLGTSFNLKAYHSDQTVAVTVLTGKVGVMASINQKEQFVKYLIRNEQININTQNGLYTFGDTDAEAARSWADNKLVYYNTPFKDITLSLERHYGTKIDFTDTDLGRLRLTAKFNNMSLEQAMADLCALAGVSYTKHNNQFFISHNNQKGGSIMK